MNILIKHGVSLAALAAVSSWSGVAMAQDAAPTSAPKTQDDEGNAEIIVTANKREERLLDVPQSVTALTGEQLQSYGVESVADLVKVTPGLTVSTTYSDTPVYTIRGVGFYENSLAVTPAVSVYLNQVPLPYSVMTEGAAFDVQRVEVLKGPQGSLFGQNATGGAINYIPAEPTRDFSAGGRLGYGNYNAVHADGYVSGALSSGLSARLSGTFDRRDGWQRSQSRPNDTNGKQNFGAGRLIVNAEPTDNLKIQFNFNGWYNKSETQAWQFKGIRLSNPAGLPGAITAINAYQATYGIAPRDARVADWDPGLDLSRDDNFLQGSMRIELDGGPVKVTSITAYSRYKRKALSDGDGTNYADLLTTQKGKINSFYQELRFDGGGFGNRLRWMLGMNYGSDVSRENQIADNRGTNNVTPFGPFFGLNQINNQSIKTMGAFGSLDVDLTNNLRLQGSVRYTASDDKFAGCVADINGSLAAVFSGISTVLSGSPYPVGQGQCVTLLTTGVSSRTILNRKLSEDNVSWRSSLSWKPGGGSTMLYVSAARGYKSGSFAALPAASVNQLTPVPQESVLAFEGGVKTRVSRAIDIEVAGFYYDYSDKQLRGTTDVPPLFLAIPALVSVPKSRVQGVEASINFRPVGGLSINAGAIYLDTEVTSSYITKDPEGVTINIKGNAFPYAPKWQANLNTRYEFALGGDLSGFFGGSLRYQDVSRSGFGNNSTYNLPAYALLDLSAGISSSDDHWKLEIWGRNVTDKYYLNNIVRPLDTIAALPGMPATYGATVGFKF